MKTLAKSISAFVLGVGIGSLIECLFTLVYGQFIVGTPAFIAAHPSPVFVRLVQTLLYGGFGLVSFWGGRIFPKDGNRSLFKATSIHFLLIFSYFVAIGFYLRWFPNTPSIFISLGLFILIYLVIWTLIYRTEKRKIDEMNRALEKNQRCREDQ